MRMIKLQDIASIDISNVDKKVKDGEKEVILCNFVDVYHNWAITSNLIPTLMRATANENQIQRFAIKKGQVAITKDSETRDDIGIPTYIADSIPDAVLGYHCALITPNESFLIGKYLNVVLHSPYAKKYFEANASGSGQRYTLTTEIIGGFPVPLIDISQQKEIGDIFANLDKRIENNNAICSNLEAMAKLLYDYWFIQFDFPDENGKPYKSSGGKMVWNDELKREIPAGWEVKPIKHICTFENGDRSDNYPKESEFVESGIPFISGSCMTGSYIDMSSVRYITREKAMSLRSGKVKKNDLLFTLRGSLGKCIYSPFENAVINAALVIIRETIVPKTYLFALLKSDYYQRLFTNNNNGSIQANLSVDVIGAMPSIVPDKKTLDAFNGYMSNINTAVLNRYNENQQLASLRDFLLPMLMNGQVKVGKESA